MQILVFVCNGHSVRPHIVFIKQYWQTVPSSYYYIYSFAKPYIFISNGYKVDDVSNYICI